MQAGVSVQAGLIKNDNVDNVVGDPDRPVPDVLPDQQPHAKRSAYKSSQLLPVVRKKPADHGPERRHGLLRIGGIGFAGLIDVANRRLVDQKMGSGTAVDLDAIAVIPLDEPL